jgi:WD40 repeat protein
MRTRSEAQAGSPTVFISYARQEDDAFVERLCRDLNTKMKVWWDKEAMESRGRTFLQELRDAIESVDRVVAIIGPKAVASDYVRYEWEHAALFGKGIIAVVRKGDFSLIPETLRPSDDYGLAETTMAQLHGEDFTDDSRYAQALRRLVELLSTPMAALGGLSGTPALPAHFRPRPNLIRGAIGTLLADVQRPMVISSVRQHSALQGMAGAGKSVLAAAIARTTMVRRAFRDGIVWLSLGRQSDAKERSAALLTNLRRLGLALGDAPSHYLDDFSARSRLSKVSSDKLCLIVLDDVWFTEQVQPFLSSVGPRCRILITTRQRDVIEHIGATSLEIGELEERDALMLLAEWSGKPVESLPEVARRVAEACGYLPLALAMIGARVRPSGRWEGALQRLKDVELAIDQAFPDYPHRVLLQAIHTSVESLNDDEIVALGCDRISRYLELSVFPEDTAVPVSALCALWSQAGLSAHATEDLVDLFVNRSLARRDAQGHLFLHDIQVDYVQKMATDPVALHARLIDGYRARCSGGWETGLDDGYFFQNLISHMLYALRVRDVETLLGNYPWVAAKLRATGVSGTIDDYDRLAPQASTTPGLWHSALRMSAHALWVHPETLPSQLAGRFQAFAPREAVLALQEQLRANVTTPWLRAITASPLDTPRDTGGRFMPHEASHVAAFALGAGLVVSVDNRAAPSVWDPNRFFTLPSGPWRLTRLGNELAVWVGEVRDCPRLVPAADLLTSALAREGTRLLVGPYDDLWLIDAGVNEARKIGRHERLRCVDMTPDGRLAATCGDDGMLRFWKLDSGSAPTVVETGEVVDSIALAADGTRAAYSVGWRARIVLIDLAGLAQRTICSDLSAPVLCLRFSPDGEQLVVGCNDGTLQRHNLRKDQAPARLGRHGSDAIVSAAFADEATLVTTARGDNRVGVWPLDRESILAQRLIESIVATAYLRDGHAICGSDTGVVSVRTASGEQIRALQLNLGRLLTLVPTSEGFVFGAGDGTGRCAVEEHGMRLVGEPILGHSRMVRFDELGHVALRTTGGDAHHQDTSLEIVDVHSGTRRLLADYSRSTGPSQELDLPDLEQHDPAMSVRVSEIRSGRAIVTVRTKEKCNFLEVWDTGQQRRLWRTEWPERGGEAWRLAISQDGQLAAARNFEGDFALWSLQSAKPIITEGALRGHSDVLAFALGHDFLVLAAEDGRGLDIWNTHDLTVQNLSFGCGVVSCRAAGGHSYLWTSLQNRRIVLWDLAAWSLVASLEGDRVVAIDNVASDGLSAVGHEVDEDRHAVMLELVRPDVELAQ